MFSRACSRRVMTGPTAQDTVSGGRAGLDVLIVEDDGLLAEELAGELASAGHRVAGRASTAHGALDLAERVPVDVALVDVELDGQGFGGDVAELLLRRHGVRSVFVSAYLDPPNRDVLRTLDPYAMLAKPHDPAELRAVLGAVRA